MGLGVAEDVARGLELGRESAAAGSCFGQFVVGVCYYNGYGGVARDFAEAARVYRLAADQGHALAQYFLGLMFEYGQGVAQDYAEAVRLYRLAADQGLADAQSDLGAMFSKGQGVAKDNAEAAQLYRLAGAQFLELHFSTACGDGTSHGTRQRSAAEEANAAFAASKSEKLQMSRNHYYELHHIADEAGNNEAEFARRWKILEDGLLAIKVKMPPAVGGGSARATHTSTDALRQRNRSKRPAPASAPASEPASAPTSSCYVIIPVSSDDASSEWRNGGESSSD
jgi:hypothetical protein